jgi:hypothetical protein
MFAVCLSPVGVIQFNFYNRQSVFTIGSSLCLLPQTLMQQLAGEQQMVLA